MASPKKALAPDFQQPLHCPQNLGRDDGNAARRGQVGGGSRAKRRRQVQENWADGEDDQDIKVLEDIHIEQMIQELLHSGSVELCFT